ALVAVDHEVAGPHAVGHEPPLGARREAGTAPAEERRVADLRVDVGRGTPERHPQRLVAAGGEVAVEGVAVLVGEPGGDDLRPVVQDVAGGVGQVSGISHRRAHLPLRLARCGPATPAPWLPWATPARRRGRAGSPGPRGPGCRGPGPCPG